MEDKLYHVKYCPKENDPKDLGIYDTFVFEDHVAASDPEEAGKRALSKRPCPDGFRVRSVEEITIQGFKINLEKRIEN